MTTKDNEALRTRLTQVSDIDGLDATIRDEVSARTCTVESASVALRDAVRDLHQAEDQAWKRYADDVEHATLVLDSTLGVASARLRAERAATKNDLGRALETATETWKTRADEIRVQTHLGELDARDQGLHALDDLEVAGRRISAVLSTLRSDASASLKDLRTTTAHNLDELGRVLQSLGSGRGRRSAPPTS